MCSNYIAQGSGFFEYFINVCLKSEHWNHVSMIHAYPAHLHWTWTLLHCGLVRQRTVSGLYYVPYKPYLPFFTQQMIKSLRCWKTLTWLKHKKQVGLLIKAPPQGFWFCFSKLSCWGPLMPNFFVSPSDPTPSLHLLSNVSRASTSFSR